MNFIKGIKRVKSLREDPFGFLSDALIKAVINIFFPIPIANEIISVLRGPALAFVLSFIAFCLFMIVTIGTIVASPLWLGSSLLERLATDLSQLPTDSSFIQSSIPSRIPLGGVGLEYASVTAGFMDPAYYLKFGKNHTGIDLVPSQKYYAKSPSYNRTHKVLVYATHTGIARYYVDSDGGETIEVTNSENSLKSVYIHFKEVYVRSGDTIAAGEPLGEMGKTGRATGEHIHYEIRIYDGGMWRTVNPFTYIK